MVNNRILPFEVLKKVATSLVDAFNQYKAPVRNERKQLMDMTLHVVEEELKFSGVGNEEMVREFEKRFHDHLPLNR